MGVTYQEPDGLLDMRRYYAGSFGAIAAGYVDGAIAETVSEKDRLYLEERAYVMARKAAHEAHRACPELGDR